MSGFLAGAVDSIPFIMSIHRSELVIYSSCHFIWSKIKKKPNNLASLLFVSSYRAVTQLPSVSPLGGSVWVPKKKNLPASAQLRSRRPAVGSPWMDLSAGGVGGLLVSVASCEGGRKTQLSLGRGLR